MTENDAIKYLNSHYLAVGHILNPPKEECEYHNSVMDMAIKSLEEIQQYRETEQKILEQLKERIKEIKKDLANIKEKNTTVRLAKKEFLTGMELAYENVVEMLRQGGRK